MRRGERRRPAAGGAMLGGVDCLPQASSRDPEDLGGSASFNPPVNSVRSDTFNLLLLLLLLLLLRK